jgi:hypothetical protein
LYAGNPKLGFLKTSKVVSKQEREKSNSLLQVDTCNNFYFTSLIFSTRRLREKELVDGTAPSGWLTPEDTMRYQSQDVEGGKVHKGRVGHMVLSCHFFKWIQTIRLCCCLCIIYLHYYHKTRGHRYVLLVDCRGIRTRVVTVTRTEEQ